MQTVWLYKHSQQLSKTSLITQVYKTLCKNKLYPVSKLISQDMHNGEALCIFQSDATFETQIQIERRGID